jgi:hypothetical protein
MNRETEELLTPLDMTSSSSGISSSHSNDNHLVSPGDDINSNSNRNSFIFSSSDESNRNSFVESQESMLTSSSSSTSLVLLPPPPDQDYSKTVLQDFLSRLIRNRNETEIENEKKTACREVISQNDNENDKYRGKVTNDALMKMKEEPDNGNTDRNHHEEKRNDTVMLGDTNGNTVDEKKEQLDGHCLEDIIRNHDSPPVLLRRKQTSKYTALDNRSQRIPERNEIKVYDDNHHHDLPLECTSSSPTAVELHSPKLLSLSRRNGQDKSCSPQKILSFPSGSTETPTMKSMTQKESVVDALLPDSLPAKETDKKRLQDKNEDTLNGNSLNEVLEGLVGDTESFAEDLLASITSLTRSFDEQFYAGSKGEKTLDTSKEKLRDRNSLQEETPILRHPSSRQSLEADHLSSLNSSDFKRIICQKKTDASSRSSVMSSTSTIDAGFCDATSSSSSISAGRRYYSRLWNKQKLTSSSSGQTGMGILGRRSMNEEWVTTATDCN